MTIEVPSSYTVVGAHITTNATRFTYTAVSRAADEYAYKDFGAGYFSGGAYLEGTGYISATAGTANKTVACVFSDGLNDWSQVANEAGGAYFSDSTNSFIRLYAVLNESSAVGGTLSGTNLSLSTVYYTRSGFLSSLGLYGGVFASAFSNSDRTTYVDSSVASRTANATYRYILAGQTYTNATANTMTGYDENITYYRSDDTGADLTTFTEVDPSAHLVQVANCSAVTTMGTNEIAYLYKDYGVDYFAANYTLRGALNVTAFASGATSTQWHLLSLTNVLSHGNTTDARCSVIGTWISATTFSLKLEEYSGAQYLTAASTTLSITKPYWVKTWRDTTVGTYGTIYLAIYGDHLMTAQIGATLSLTLHASVSYRYFHAHQAHYLGAGASTVSFSFGGVTATLGSQSASYTGSGGVILGGTSTTSKSAHSTGVGGFIVGGTSSSRRTTSYIAVGGLVIGGQSVASANGAQSASHTGSGGILFGGTSNSTKSTHSTSSGGVIFGGTSSYSFTLSTNVQEIVFELYDSNGNPITGATTVTCKLRTTPGSQIYDWNPATSGFKSSGWTTVAATMSEIDPVNLPGLYKKEFGVTTFANGRYQVFCSYSSTISQHASIEFLIDDGKIVDEYTATKVDAINTTVGLLPSASVTATAVRNELSIELSDIVDTHTKTVLLSKIARNQYTLNPVDGTIKILDDDGVTVLYSGLAYSDAAGTTLYNGTAAVHRTSRLI